MGSDFSPEYIAFLRRMSGEEKLRAAFQLYRAARTLKAAAIRDRHPDWSEERVRQEVKESSFMPEAEPFLLFTRRLNELGLPYMVSGSVAAIYYGEPRLTNDIDIVLVLRGDDIERFAASIPCVECGPHQTPSYGAALVPIPVSSSRNLEFSRSTSQRGSRRSFGTLKRDGVARSLSISSRDASVAPACARIWAMDSPAAAPET